MPNATLDRLSDTEVRITVKLDADDYQKPAKAELKRLAKGAQIKGFRPGKVPASYMEKVYGRSVLADAIGKAVDTSINELIEQEKLEIFGQLASVEEPKLDDKLSMKLDEELTFVYEGGLMPKVDKVDTSSLKEVNRYTVKLTDEEAGEKLDNARKRFMDYIERDTIETEEDFATLVVADAELDAKHFGAEAAAHSAEPTKGNDAKDGADADSAQHDGDDSDADTQADRIEDDPRQRYFIRAADLTEEQRYKLIDKAKGTEVILALADLNEDVRERFDKVITEDGTTSFTIAKVDREQLPDFGPDTFKKIFGEESEVSTEDEGKAEFSRRFAENSQANLDDFALEQLIDKLVESNEVEVPQKAIKARLEQARAEELAAAKKEDREPNYDHELTEADRHGLSRRLRWLALRQGLLEQYKVELEASDIDAGLERQYQQQLAGMGLDPEQYRAQFFPMFKKNFLENREQVMEMTDGLLNRKLMHRLEEEGVIGSVREVGEKEFSELVEAYNTRVSSELDKMREQPLGESA